MASLNKRHQARNERALQDLIRTVPGNDKCADCGQKNPAWASWSLGVFLCIRCASIHRKLGTHVSKVKSISMDSWTNEQVDNMKKTGNDKSNEYYNPDPSKHPPPLNSEETDSQLERYIRQKYEYQSFRKEYEARTGSSSSKSDTKNGSGSGASYQNGGSLTVPSGKKSTRRSIVGLFRSSSPNPPSSHHGHSNSSSPPKDKAAQVLGGTPYTDHSSKPVVFPHGMVTLPPESKYSDQLLSLHEMGFTDKAQNLEVIVKTNGNILNAVEILVQLARQNGTTQGSRSRPEPPPKNDAPAPQKETIKLAGITVQKTGPASLGGGSNNPFEALDKEQQQLPPLPPPPKVLSAAHTGGSAPMVMSQQPLGLGLSQPYQQQQQQPLQACQTGASMPAQFGQQPMQAQQTGFYNPQQQQFQQPLQQQQTGWSQASSNPYQQTQPLQPQHTAFSMNSLASALPVQQTGASNNPYSSMPNTSTFPTTANPFFQQPQQQQAPLQSQQTGFFNSSQPQPQAQQPQQPQTQPQLQTQQTGFYIPQLQQSQFQPQPLQQSYTFPVQLQQQPQPAYPQQSLRKDDILSLFSAPQLAPQPNQNPIPITSTTTQQPAAPTPQQPQVGSNNPFLAKKPAAVGGPMSRESVDFGGGAWGNGRHSPDAFASLAFGGR